MRNALLSELVLNTQKCIDLSKLNNSQEPLECLILLNQPAEKNLLQCFAEKALSIILSDGGANVFSNHSEKYDHKVVGVVGDFDSIAPTIRDSYSLKGKTVIMPSQDQSDFQKSLRLGLDFKYKEIFLLGAIGNRMDHTFNNISSAINFKLQYPHQEIILLNDKSLLCCLGKDTSYKVTVGSLFKKKQCGLICFGGPCKIETRGFKWNIGEHEAIQELEFGKIVSSSNEIVEDQVYIRANSNIFLSLQFKLGIFQAKNSREIN